MNTRAEILKRIESAAGIVRAVGHSHGIVARSYQQSDLLNLDEKLDLFTNRLLEYDAQVIRCSSTEIVKTIQSALSARDKKRLIVPPGLVTAWLPQQFTYIVDHDTSYEEIDRCDGVITGCAIAVALTGTIILRHTQTEGRRALTLIPDYHLCVVQESQVVETVPEAIRKMQEFARFPITMVSGPSATSDIEMTRVKGVHGPRSVDVLLVKD